MAICASIVNIDGHNVVVTAPEVLDLSTCAYVLQSGVEVNLWPTLTEEDALAVGSAATLVIATAWFWKMVIKLSGEL